MRIDVLHVDGVILSDRIFSNKNKLIISDGKVVNELPLEIEFANLQDFSQKWRQKHATLARHLHSLVLQENFFFLIMHHQLHTDLFRLLYGARRPAPCRVLVLVRAAALAPSDNSGRVHDSTCDARHVLLRRLAIEETVREQATQTGRQHVVLGIGALVVLRPSISLVVLGDLVQTWIQSVSTVGRERRRVDPGHA